MDPTPLPTEIAERLTGAIEGQHWVLTGALGVIALLAIVRRAGLLGAMPPRYLPAVAVALGVLGAVAAALVEGRSPVEAVITGLVAGSSAVGLHQAGRKTVGGPRTE